MTPQDKEQQTNSKLVSSLKAGNPLAFRQVYMLFEKRVFGFVYSITKSEYVSEEIVQEVFIRIWSQRETLDPERAFDSYIFTVARNLTYNYLRDASRRESIRNELWANVSAMHRQVEADLALAEYKTIVDNIVNKLPPQKRLIYQLSRQEGKSNSEIADMLGISPKTVKNHLWHTMATIRSQIQPHLEDTLPFLLLIMFSL